MPRKVTDQERGGDRVLMRMPLRFIAARLAAYLGAVILSVCLVQVAGDCVGISKSVLYFASQPGGTQEALFTIENNEGQKLAVRIRLVDWDDTPDGRTLLLPTGTIARSCATWIGYTPQTFELLPGQKQEIHATMSVPASAAGTYWAAFLVDNPTDPATSVQGGIRAKTQFLIKIYQTSLPAVTSGRITKVAVDGLNPLGVTIGFNNTGKTLMQDVHATTTLQDQTGRTLGDFSSDPFSVLPGHAVDITMPSSFYMKIPGVYLVTAVVDYGADYLVAGQVGLQIKPLSLSPIGPSVNTPTDLDGDDLYEDINGDGRLTEGDLSLFTTHLDDTCIMRNVRAFDYSNDGKIGQDDVDLLRGMISRNTRSGA